MHHEGLKLTRVCASGVLSRCKDEHFAGVWNMLLLQEDLMFPRTVKSTERERDGTIGI